MKQFTKLLQWCGNPHHPALRSFSLELARELYACLHVQCKPQGAISNQNVLTKLVPPNLQ